MPRPANPDVRNRLRVKGGDLIHQTSFGATGVQGITAAAGVPKGSFYNYFDSKDAYAAEILDEYWRGIDEAYGPLLRDAGRKPLAAIGDFFAGLTAFHAQRQFIPGCLIGNLALELAATSDVARDKLSEIFARWGAGIAARLTEAGRGDGADIAAALIDAFEGAVLRAKVDRGQAALDRFTAITLPRLLG